MRQKPSLQLPNYIIDNVIIKLIEFGCRGRSFVDVACVDHHHHHRHHSQLALFLVLKHDDSIDLFTVHYTVYAANNKPISIPLTNQANVRKPYNSIRQSNNMVLHSQLPPPKRY